MSDLHEYARRLAASITTPLFFDEAERLASDLFADIGKPFPTTGDPAAAAQEIARVLGSVGDFFQLGRALLFVGYLIERGAPASSIGPVALAKLPDLLSAAARAAAAHPPARDTAALARAVARTDPDGAAAMLGLEPALAGAMQILCVDRHSRRALSSHAHAVDDARALGSWSVLAYYLAELVDSSDEQRLIVIDPKRRRGASVVADGVRNGFHLFVLLEAVLVGTDGKGLWGGAPVPAAPVEIARGRRPPQPGLTARAHFDYYNWSAWAAGGLVADAPTRWIWGELPLLSIPIAHGERIVLVDAPQYDRSWDMALASAVHPQHQPSVTLERELTTEEVERWLTVIVNAPDEARARMRYAGVKLD